MKGIYECIRQTENLVKEGKKETIEVKNALHRVISDDIHLISEDYKIPSGTILKGAHIGALESNGLTEVIVYKKLIVGVMSIGRKDINGATHLIYNNLRELGCTPIAYEPLLKDENEINKVVQSLEKRCDFIIVLKGLDNTVKLNYTDVYLDRREYSIFNTNNKIKFQLSGDIIAISNLFNIFIRNFIANSFKCSEIKGKWLKGYYKGVYDNLSDEDIIENIYLKEGTINLIFPYDKNISSSKIILSNTLMIIPKNRKIEKDEKISFIYY